MDTARWESLGFFAMWAPLLPFGSVTATPIGRPACGKCCDARRALHPDFRLPLMHGTRVVASTCDGNGRRQELNRNVSEPDALRSTADAENTLSV